MLSKKTIEEPIIKDNGGEEMKRAITNLNQLRIVIITILGLGLLFIGVAFSESFSSSVKIGAVLPLTGDSAAWGEQGKYGIEMAVEEINSKNGINGKRLEVVYEDSQAIPKNAVSSIQKLVNVDKVPAIVGDIVSSTTLAMAPIAERSKTVLMAISASAPTGR